MGTAEDEGKILEFETLERQARNPFEGQVLRILKALSAQVENCVTASQRNLNETISLRGDVATLRTEIQVFEETAKDSRRIALRAEDMSEMTRDKVDRKVRNALDTLPDAIEVQRIAREAADAAGERAAFEATETATGRFRALVEKERERPLPSDPVRAAVKKAIREHERDALVERVQWWQSTALKWALGGATGGWAILRALEAFLTAHHP